MELYKTLNIRNLYQLFIYLRNLNRIEKVWPREVEAILFLF